MYVPHTTATKFKNILDFPIVQFGYILLNNVVISITYNYYALETGFVSTKLQCTNKT